jgi:hypothetical protein
VEELGPAAEELGLTRSSLQTDTELQLRQYSIKVPSEKERLRMPNSPYLYVNVNIVDTDNDLVPLVAVSVSVSLRETVLLARGRAASLNATTWRQVATVLVGELSIWSVRDGVRDLVAMFINAYLTANPGVGKVNEANARALPGLLDVQAIAGTGDGQYLVVIAGEMFEAGDTVQGYTIRKVEEDKIEFGKDGQVFVQAADQPCRTRELVHLVELAG